MGASAAVKGQRCRGCGAENGVVQVLRVCAVQMVAKSKVPRTARRRMPGRIFLVGVQRLCFIVYL